jgi:hypothetical protein
MANKNSVNGQPITNSKVSTDNKSVKMTEKEASKAVIQAMIE